MLLKFFSEDNFERYRANISLTLLYAQIDHYNVSKTQ
jgi:hypothetical protein